MRLSPKPRELYPQYEDALVTNTVEKAGRDALVGTRAMRSGAIENLYGYKEIDVFPKVGAVANLVGTVTRLDVVCFDNDFATITLEFEQ